MKTVGLETCIITPAIILTMVFQRNVIKGLPSFCWESSNLFLYMGSLC